MVTKRAVATSEDLGSNPAVSKIYSAFFIANCWEKTKNIKSPGMANFKKEWLQSNILRNIFYTMRCYFNQVKNCIQLLSDQSFVIEKFKPFPFPKTNNQKNL